jgi:hypothetical protein
MTTIQKMPLLLEGPKDWDEWYEIVRSSAQARGVFQLVNINAATQPMQPTRPAEPLYQDIKQSATSYTALDDKEKDHYKVLLTEYRNRLARFDKEQAALIDILNHIQNTVARGLRTYMYGLDTPFEILKALKKRLAPTDRARRLELAREYQALKKAPRAQSLDSWLQLWETIFAEAEKLQLAEIQDNKALYDFILAIKGVDTAYANAYLSDIKYATVRSSWAAVLLVQQL